MGESVKASAERRVMRETADAVLERMLGLMPVCSISATMQTQRHRRHEHMQWCGIYATHSDVAPHYDECEGKC